MLPVSTIYLVPICSGESVTACRCLQWMGQIMCSIFSWGLLDRKIISVYCSEKALPITEYFFFQRPLLSNLIRDYEFYYFDQPYTPKKVFSFAASRKCIANILSWGILMNLAARKIAVNFCYCLEIRHEFLAKAWQYTQTTAPKITSRNFLPSYFAVLKKAANHAHQKLLQRKASC